MEVDLNRPQMRFLGLPQKYRAFVAGFGCVHADTRVWTKRGLMRIADISSATRVLSWNERSQRFQLSWCGGSFPKGREKLRRVSTSSGEFVSSGHHRMLSSSGKYEPVSDLVSGDRVDTCSPDLLRTIQASDRLSSLLDVQHLKERHVNSLERYADAARQYGQRFLSAAGIDQVSAPLSDGAPELCLSDGPAAFLHEDGLPGRMSGHTRHGQSFSRHDRTHSMILLLSLVFGVAGRTLEQLPGRIYESLHTAQLSVLKFFGRRSIERRSVGGCSFSNPLVMGVVDSIRVTGEDSYWDMQVANTNNYVDEFGHIHHNSGKTWVGCVSQINHYLKHPRVKQGYFSPTFAMNRDIFYPTIDEVAFYYGMKTMVRKGDREVDFYLGRKYYGTTICKTMDNPEAIIGFKIGRALVDELDTLSSDKARRAWVKIIARLRVKGGNVQNGIDVTTTPEGYKEVYTRFHKNVIDKPSLIKRYGYIRASTYENEANLPEDYIESLEDSYPEQLIKAYLRGEFTNLESGSVYTEFDRAENNTDTIASKNEALIIGMDFNVERACSVVFVERGKELHAVGEVFNAYDTREQIHLLKEMFPGSAMHVYPDLTGRKRNSTNATESDLILLKNAGFTLHEKGVNPPIKERVNAVNGAFMNDNVRVNIDKCPNLTNCLEQQVWDRHGMPEKETGKDDINDAFGYPVHKFFRIRRTTVFKTPRQRIAVGAY